MNFAEMGEIYNIFGNRGSMQYASLAQEDVKESYNQPFQQDVWVNGWMGRYGQVEVSLDGQHGCATGLKQ